MRQIEQPWDYLIVTASNERQAEAYEQQLQLRWDLGLIAGVKKILVVSDPGGRRIGSGGSTVYSLLQALSDAARGKGRGTEGWPDLLRRLRILIVHAGGDSQRLPSYGPCGKVFVPVPGESFGALGVTLFDRQLPIYLALGSSRADRGRVVITSGDVLINFDPGEIDLSASGLLGLGCFATPEVGSRHGVYSLGPHREVRRFLQKPSVDEQRRSGAVTHYGQTVLDIGVFSLDPDTSLTLLELFGTEVRSSADLRWGGPITEQVLNCGADFYREFCCALGSEATFESYCTSCRKAGSRLPAAVLKMIFDSLSDLRFSVALLRRCEFLHFGTSRQIIQSGNMLVSRELGVSHQDQMLTINTSVAPGAELSGTRSWVEGCRLGSRLQLGGDNVIVGLDFDEPTEIPEGVCLEVLQARSRKSGDKFWVVRWYGVKDQFNDPIDRGATFCNIPARRWFECLEADAGDLWENGKEASLWSAKLFPRIQSPGEFRAWHWMANPKDASAEQKALWKNAHRYSCADLAVLTDLDAFYRRRLKIRLDTLGKVLDRLLSPSSPLSAKELAFLMRQLTPEGRVDWIAAFLSRISHYRPDPSVARDIDDLALSRALHTLGTALLILSEQDGPESIDLPGVFSRLSDQERERLRSLGIELRTNPIEWAKVLQGLSFDHLARTIIWSDSREVSAPKNVLRSDEIIWGRAPARLDLGGGWSDTPPYSLERGGCVVNAAVDLNGQPPIHVYGRVIEEPEIRLVSIDHSDRVIIRDFDQLVSYRRKIDRFALARAALVLSGFGLESGRWPSSVSSLEDVLLTFGGGIELTTLAAIPSGSGLGTSSIMGAVLIGVVSRMIGRELTRRELFNHVLRLEQELTTGGGWQDQVGGVIEGVKMITSDRGLVPDPRINFVPHDLMDPAVNGGRTLLFYTGIRRLAKNILHEVVGGYLDRDRKSVDTLERIHRLPPLIVDTLSRKDLTAFGAVIDTAWRLNRQLDPDSTTEEIEGVLARIRPHVLGAKLLGAGGGGFLLIVCPSSHDAGKVRELLTAEPPNARARFFDYRISREGLSVTVC